MKPIISIIIPVYNMGHCIKKSVMSILNQSNEEYEVILVDDGSTDNSLAECNALEQLDGRVRTFHTENAGSGPARNYGISVAGGSYAYFMDADDLLETNAIEDMVAAIRLYEPDLLIFGFRKLNNNDKVIGEKKYQNEIVYGSQIRKDYSDYYDMNGRHTIQGAPWNKLFNLNIIKANDISYPSLRRHQDDAFIGRYMCFAEKIVFIDKILYTHYINDLKTVWKKYPINYIDSAIGLYECRKQTILKWNNNDKKTQQIINSEFICNSIKGFEIFFSPKGKMNTRQRYEKITEAIEKSGICDIDEPNSLGAYQNIVYNAIKAGSYRKAFTIIRLKVFLEKIGVVSIIKLSKP